MKFLLDYLATLLDNQPAPPRQYEPDVPQTGRIDRHEFYGNPSEAILHWQGSLNAPAAPPKTMSQVAAQVENMPTGRRLELVPHLQDEARIAGRSAITGLAFDPRRFYLDRDQSYGSASGVYFPTKDVGYADLGDRSTLVHETAHRGMGQLDEDPEKLDPAKWFSPEGRAKSFFDELAVRRLMQRIAPGEEDRTADPETTQLVNFFGPLLDRYLGQLEGIAAEAVKNKRPGGPR